MAENFSIERRKIMRFLGAKVVLTPAAEKGSALDQRTGEATIPQVFVGGTLYSLMPGWAQKRRGLVRSKM